MELFCSLLKYLLNYWLQKNACDTAFWYDKPEILIYSLILYKSCKILQKNVPNFSYWRETLIYLEYMIYKIHIVRVACVCYFLIRTLHLLYSQTYPWDVLCAENTYSNRIPKATPLHFRSTNFFSVSSVSKAS